MQRLKRMLYGLFLVFLLAAGLSGCATMRGLGEDIESAGRALQDAAE